MQQEPLEISQQTLRQTSSQTTASSTQDGLIRPRQGLPDDGPASPGRDISPRAGPADCPDPASPEGVNATQLDARLSLLSGHHGLPHDGSPESPASAAGQRVSEYERAMTPITPRKPLGFKVVKRTDASSNGMQLQDFPNGS